MFGLKACGRPRRSCTGRLVGEPRLLICLFDDPLLHVDLKFAVWRCVELYRELRPAGIVRHTAAEEASTGYLAEVAGVGSPTR